MVVFCCDKGSCVKRRLYVRSEGGSTKEKDAPTPKHISEGGMLHDVAIIFVDVRFVQGILFFVSLQKLL